MLEKVGFRFRRYLKLPGIAMRLVVGSESRVRMRHGGPIAPTEAVDVVRQLAGAVASAHAVGLVHRDVSREQPWN